jgi:hypothetical protein
MLSRKFVDFTRDYNTALIELKSGLGLGGVQDMPLTMPPPLLKANPTVMISGGWADYNIERETELGMLIHVHFTISNFKERNGWAVAYFYSAAGAPLIDSDGLYVATGNSHAVLSYVTFQPGYDPAEYADLQIFMPYSQLHVPSGFNSLQYYVSIRDSANDQQLAASTWFPFNYTRAPVVIDKVWVDYNVKQGSEDGITIHLKFEMVGYQSHHCKTVTYFYYEDGTPIKDTDQQYRTIDGQVSRSEDFVPPYYDSVYNDFTLFMPNAQLDTKPGKADLKFQIKLWDMDTNSVLASSTWVHFWYEHQ